MITIEHNILDNLFDYIPKDLHHHQMVIVTDQTVAALYAEKVLSQLPAAKLFSIPPGEQSKTRETKASIESFLAAQQCGRDTCLIALGGGVVGDITGFVAATYMRGIPYIQVPTTLLAMVDSSVGGKTAINTPEGKNLIGAFWEPRSVIADLNCLATLPQEHIHNGWFEALKIFLITDADAFNQAGQYNADLIRRAVKIKQHIVSQDLTEKGLRSVLNLGHTIGHAIEKITDYSILHGYAVAYGILLEAKISMLQGLLSEQVFCKIQDALYKLGVSSEHLKAYDIEQIIAATVQDKKNKKHLTHYVLLKNMGEVFVSNESYTHPVEPEQVKQAYHALVNGESYAR